MKNCKNFWRTSIVLLPLTMAVALIVYAVYLRVQNTATDVCAIADYNDSSEVQSKRSESEVQ